MNVTELAFKDLMEEDKESNENELLELLEFYRHNGVPLTEKQVKATLLLHEFGLDDISQFANSVRPQMTKPKMFMKLIEKITLADRIKGNAKLSNLLKANVASTSQQVPNASDYQAKAMRKSELR